MGPDRVVLDDGTTRQTYAAPMDRVHGLAGRILDANCAHHTLASPAGLPCHHRPHQALKCLDSFRVWRW